MLWNRYWKPWASINSGMEFPSHWLVNSNFSEGWEGEPFTFVWKLTKRPDARTKAEIRRHARILNMIRVWCRVEVIGEAWAETLTTSKMGSLELVEGTEAIEKYLEFRGCRL